MNAFQKKFVSIASIFSMLFVMMTMLLTQVGEVSSLFAVATGNQTKTVLNVDEDSLTLSNSYEVNIESSGLSSGGLFSLDAEGYIRNTDPIRGISSISITYGDGSGWAKIVPCYYDYEGDAVVTTSSSWGDAVSSMSFDAPVDYFEIYNPQEDSIVISSMTIVYSCSTSEYSFSVSFTPDWNDKEAENAADIYIAGTRELISDGSSDSEDGWNYKKMTYSNGVYSYTAPSNLPQGSYTYAFYAEENGATFSWHNPNASNNISVELTSNYFDNTAYAWDYEPGYVSPTSYSITFNVNLGSNNNITWLEFSTFVSSDNNLTKYNGDLSYVGGTNSVGASSTTLTYTNIDQGNTVYFTFKMWDTSYNGNIVVAADTSHWYALKYVPFELEDVVITIDVDSYASAAKVYAYSSASVSPTGAGIVATAVESTNTISHSAVAVDVYGTSTISPTFSSGSSDAYTASYKGENIRIDDNSTIVGIKAGTVTAVTLTTYLGATCTFNVTVNSSTYTADKDLNYCGGSKAVSVTEGWFSSTSVSEISNMGSDFYNGIDVSSFKALIDKGTKFYNASGVEQHLLYILKDAGVNWIRLKLWVDPQSSDDSVLYGGGQSDLEHTLWMAKEVKKAGLNFLLDFHYSDYWTHPGQQIIPKAWNDCTSKSALCARIKSYTTETLQSFKDASCLPDMVQLGNEISSGIYLQKFSGSSESLDSYGQPTYLTGKSSYGYGTSNSNQYSDYIIAASEGVDAVDSSIKKVLHWAKGSTISASKIKSFFADMPSDYYDYAAISFYPFYCFDSLSVAQTILNGLSGIAKPWFIAETSYPFSGSGYTDDGMCNFTISNYNYGDTSIHDSYAFTSSGQANMIHDLTKATVDAGGLGIFYWEGAWVPNASVGWAGSGSQNTWGNQGFFSFDGKAIANLDLFAQMSPYI